MFSNIFFFFITLLLAYFISSFAVYISHRFFHKLWSGPLYKMHILGHHVAYPKQDVMSWSYRTPKTAHSGKVASLIPFLVFLAAVFLIFPPPYHWVALISGIFFTLSSTHWFHKQMHLRDSPLQRFKWFRYRRKLHILHHVKSRKNFGLAESFYDRLFQTHYDPTHHA